MRRLLLVVCWLAAAQTVCARKSAVRFDLPYTLERGKYVVTVETAAGPRRFAFDTGASQTCISERLSRELGLAASGRGTSGDFEGHRHAITYVRVPYLRMGEATYSDRQVIVLPDSSYIFRCLGFDGIAGSDLLRGFVVRMPNADSTITLAGDLRQLGGFRCRGGARIHFAGNAPVIAARVGSGQVPDENLHEIRYRLRGLVRLPLRRVPGDDRKGDFAGGAPHGGTLRQSGVDQPLGRR